MPQTSVSSKNYNFKPVDFDASSMEPDVYPGYYEAKIDSAKVIPTSKDGYPMLVMDYRITKALSDGEDCEKSVGGFVTDFIAFFPERDSEGHVNRAGRLSKIKFRDVCDALNLSYDIVPKRIESDEDFKDFINEAVSQTIKVWVVNKKGKDGEDRAEVRFKAPAGAMGELSPVEPMESEEEEPHRSNARKSNGKAHGKRR
jgi:hypothetical protein